MQFTLLENRIISERRRSRRLPTSGTAVLEWNDRSGPRKTLVLVKTMSTEGMTIELPDSVKAPRMARLIGKTWQCLGWLRYCERRGGKFVAGLEFTQNPRERTLSTAKSKALA